MNQRTVQRDTDRVTDHNEFFYYLFQHSTVGQVVMNKNMDILFANDQIFRCFQSEPREAAGLSFGNAFHCMKLRHGRHQCGEVERCKNCGVWCCVRQVLLDGDPVQNATQYSFRSERRRIKKWFQLSGGKVAWQEEQYAAIAFIDISEMKQKERHLKTKLTLDLATGTLNKTCLMNSLRQMMEPDKTDGDFTICMIDFDHFKLINDRYGHLMGDKVLEVFSKIARSHVRGNDLIGRYGGEEFIFIFRETDEGQALQILKRIHRELEEYFSKEIEIPVTFSAGAISLEMVNGLASYTDLLSDVDKMLYQAKRLGKGRAVSSTGETVFTSFGLEVGSGVGEIL